MWNSRWAPATVTMRFEDLEQRIVFDQSLSAAVDLDIGAFAPAPFTEPSNPIPADIQFRSTADDFEYASRKLDPAAIDLLISTTREWNQKPAARGTYQIDETDLWHKAIGYYPPQVTADGVIVAKRFRANTNAHTMMVARKDDSQCFGTDGLYTQPDYHYHFSFEVRHPRSEMSWLSDHQWAIVMQLWGPREAGESPRNPPFSIYSKAIDGKPTWIVKSYGDARLSTQSGEFEETRAVQIPMTGVGQWHRFDVEFVPNAFGRGLIRTWLDGQLVAEWKDIKNIYHSLVGNQPSGPLNPSFGLYSSMDEDGMEVHLDNIALKCNGPYQSSLAGAVSSLTALEGNLVIATNEETGESYGTYTESSGVYTLAVPRGVYEVTAVNGVTGTRSSGARVSTESKSQLVNLDVTAAQRITLTGDVTGDGKSDIINRRPDGSWAVSIVNDNGTYETSTWGRWSPAVRWDEVLLADFTGDGKQDIAGRVADGNWWLAESTGTGFRNRHWGTWSATVTWSDTVVGDFDGNGRSDLAGREASSGIWWVSRSTGAGLSTRPWGRWSTAVTWTDAVIGDFNGDGLSDIAGRVAADGNWWVALSTGSRFRNRHWGSWYTGVEWTEVAVGDFNGDRISDIVGRTADGNWWVAHSTGDRFLNTHWGRWSTRVSWSDISVADVNGDGKSDLVGRASLDGSWWVARSSGNRFLNHLWGAIWSPNEDWLAVSVEDFDGDGRADLLGAKGHRWLLAV